MELSALREKLLKRLLEALPGALAHEPMRAVPVGSTIPNFQHKLPPKPGAVLILLYEEAGHIKFPLIVRPEYAGAHSGQISLPGGKAEIGEDAIQTALREGEEEIGIDRTQVDVIGKLTDFFVIPSNFLVTPVVGIIHDPIFRADAREVSRIISCTLFDLLLEGAIKTKEITAAGKYRMMAPHFEIDGEVVWGATAMMLNEFRTVLLEP
ncbi:NUDIX hydrolase [Pseudochryseolinea flava]|uniref:Coenzyme A pyrophosphatase n=1 Tax=Pseudochryseolinea flava TaxID=2059302 RepID=A0A364XWC6_9BACT|nr:CoA pyrophosphatase [Pseudochryseolinea flava]RAV98657.1 coenzyme A pyrophosphatase [Pseudochryseolinea flava]